MRTPEDPCRDPASEARDDHASEPRATPETDALVPSQGRRRTMREYIDELEAHARRLERQRDEYLEQSAIYIGKFVDMNIRRHIAESQRDELLGALENISFGTVIKRAPGGCGQQQLWTAAQMSQHAEAAIAAVKGGNG